MCITHAAGKGTGLVHSMQTLGCTIMRWQWLRSRERRCGKRCARRGPSRRSGFSDDKWRPPNSAQERHTSRITRRYDGAMCLVTCGHNATTSASASAQILRWHLVETCIKREKIGLVLRSSLVHSEILPDAPHAGCHRVAPPSSRSWPLPWLTPRHAPPPLHHHRPLWHLGR